MDFVIPSGHRPALGVEPGQMARLEFDARKLGIVPTLDPADERRLRVEIYDLTLDPKALLADIQTSVGAAPLDVQAASLTLSIRSTRNP